MFFTNHQSRFKSTNKINGHQQQHLKPTTFPSSIIANLFNVRFKSSSSSLYSSVLRAIVRLLTIICGPLIAIYYSLSMSMFYQVMGAVKCGRIKKHAGIKLRPINKAKEPFVANDMLIYSCESAEFTQTIRCLDDGSWSDTPHCPDPVNYTCPDLAPLQHGFYSSASASPFKVGATVAFRCENEILPSLNFSLASNNSNFPIMTTTTFPSEPQLSLLSQNLTSSGFQNTTNAFYENFNQVNTSANVLRYNLTGDRVLKCLPSSKWNHPMPTCLPVYPEPQSNVGFLLASTALILIPILILVTVFHLFMRWRKRQLQRERWKQYFTDYKYRHSKTSITFGMRPNSQAATIPVTDL